MKRFFLSALSFSLMVACSTDVDESYPEGGEVQFTASLTRAYDATWESDDRVGIFALGQESQTSVNYSNYQYVVDPTTSAMSAVSNLRKVCVDVAGVDEQIKYYSYYPYSVTAVTDFTYTFDLVDQSDLAAIDLLWAEPVTKAAQDFDVEFKYEHKLAKLLFEIEMEDGSSVEGLEAVLSGTISAGTFDIKTGELASTATADIALLFQYNEDYTKATATVLVYPSTSLTTACVKFKTASEISYPCYLSNYITEIDKWESGYSYSYTGIKLELED